MSTPINDGGPAYPCHTNPLPEKLANAPQGMSLRDWFAGQFLAGFVASQYQGGKPRNMATQAYEHADAMLEARKGGRGA